MSCLTSENNILQLVLSDGFLPIRFEEHGEAASSDLHKSLQNNHKLLQSRRDHQTQKRQAQQKAMYLIAIKTKCYYPNLGFNTKVVWTVKSYEGIV